MWIAVSFTFWIEWRGSSCLLSVCGWAASQTPTEILRFGKEKWKKCTLRDCFPAWSVSGWTCLGDAFQWIMKEIKASIRSRVSLLLAVLFQSCNVHPAATINYPTPTSPRLPPASPFTLPLTAGSYFVIYQKSQILIASAWNFIPASVSCGKIWKYICTSLL